MFYDCWNFTQFFNQLNSCRFLWQIGRKIHFNISFLRFNHKNASFLIIGFPLWIMFCHITRTLSLSVGILIYRITIVLYIYYICTSRYIDIIVTTFGCQGIFCFEKQGRDNCVRLSRLQANWLISHYNMYQYLYLIAGYIYIRQIKQFF